MGSIRMIYDETSRQMKRIGWSGQLKTSGVRKASSGGLRYCLQDDVLYLPADESIIKNHHRFCWGIVRSEELDFHPWLLDFDKEVPSDPLELIQPGGIGFGVKYSVRHYESPNGRIAVNEFVAQSIITGLADNPEALPSISKENFEKLIAELFARSGFEVDLFRKSKDDGIDFLAIKNDDAQPIVVAVQTKHPDPADSSGKRSTLPVATVREIYGVSKAWDLGGAIAVTSSKYSPAAKKFAELKPQEIKVYGLDDVLDWIKKYRWNTNE